MGALNQKADLVLLSGKIITVDKAFMANLVQANKFFISNEDIRWLPEDLKQKKQVKK